LSGKNYQRYARPYSFIVLKKSSKIPCPDISIINQNPFITIVDKILPAKEKNPEVDTSPLEKQLDEMVYKLYELTEEGIKIIEGKK
jgi:hypothetical protein